MFQRDACPSMPPLPCSPPPPVKDVRSKYCQEIGAEMIGNHLIIRLEKDKDKSKKKRDEWDPPCDCIEIQRPTSKTGARIINATQDDRVIFRVHTPSTSQTEESGYTSQTIGYKVSYARPNNSELFRNYTKSVSVFNFVSTIVEANRE